MSSSFRPSKRAGRSSGVAYSLEFEYVPCRSGSPHGVRGVFHVWAAVACASTRRNAAAIFTAPIMRPKGPAEAGPYELLRLLSEGDDVAVRVEEGELGDAVPLLLERHHDLHAILQLLIGVPDVAHVDEERQ